MDPRRRLILKLFGTAAVAPNAAADAAAQAGAAAISVIPSAASLNSVFGMSKQAGLLNTFSYNTPIYGVRSIGTLVETLQGLEGHLDNLSMDNQGEVSKISDGDVAYLRELHSYRLQEKHLEDLLAEKGLLEKHKKTYETQLAGVKKICCALKKSSGRRPRLNKGCVMFSEYSTAMKKPPQMTILTSLKRIIYAP